MLRYSVDMPCLINGEFGKENTCEDIWYWPYHLNAELGVIEEFHSYVNYSIVSIQFWHYGWKECITS